MPKILLFGFTQINLTIVEFWLHLSIKINSSAFGLHKIWKISHLIVTLAMPKILLFGFTQINLVNLSLNRNFAVRHGSKRRNIQDGAG